MKIEQVLVHYLLKNKKLTLQGIGTFDLNATVPDTADSEKPVVLPEDSVTFHYNPKATEDEGLVDFIVEYTHKIKPLAASDLDSFLSLGRQFLNLGKPFVLPHIGTLEKLNSGVLAFKPGQLVAEKLEPQKVKIEEAEPTAEEERLFSDFPTAKRSGGGGKFLVVLIILILLGLIGWAVWHYGYNENHQPSTITSTEPIVPLKDSAFRSDSTIIANATLDSAKAANDSVDFLVIISRYHSLPSAAWKKKTLLHDHPTVDVFTSDSSLYKVGEPFKLPLSDTTRIIDSLKRIFPKAFIEIK